MLAAFNEVLYPFSTSVTFFERHSKLTSINIVIMRVPVTVHAF